MPLKTVLSLQRECVWHFLTMPPKSPKFVSKWMPFGTTWSLQVVKKVSQEESKKRIKNQKAYEPFWVGTAGCPARGEGLEDLELKAEGRKRFLDGSWPDGRRTKIL